MQHLLIMGAAFLWAATIFTASPVLASMAVPNWHCGTFGAAVYSELESRSAEARPGSVVYGESAPFLIDRVAYVVPGQGEIASISFLRLRTGSIGEEWSDTVHVVDYRVSPDYQHLSLIPFLLSKFSGKTSFRKMRIAVDAEAFAEAGSNPTSVDFYHYARQARFRYVGRKVEHINDGDEHSEIVYLKFDMDAKRFIEP